MTSVTRRTRACLAVLAGGVALTGCAPGPSLQAATSDSVLRAQYAAAGPHGAISGEEATRIVRRYDDRIATPAPAIPRAMEGQNLEEPASR